MQTRDGICYSSPGIILYFTGEFFPHSSEKKTKKKKKKLFGADYPLAFYTKTIIHLQFGEQLLIVNSLNPGIMS